MKQGRRGRKRKGAASLYRWPENVIFSKGLKGMKESEPCGSLGEEHSRQGEQPVQRL